MRRGLGRMVASYNEVDWGERVFVYLCGVFLYSERFVFFIFWPSLVHVVRLCVCLAVLGMVYLLHVACFLS
jgi:hypothetical protein